MNYYNYFRTCEYLFIYIHVKFKGFSELFAKLLQNIQDNSHVTRKWVLFQILQKIDNLCIVLVWSIISNSKRACSWLKLHLYNKLVTSEFTFLINIFLRIFIAKSLAEASFLYWIRDFGIYIFH
mgnify:CR=1 FL=1